VLTSALNLKNRQGWNIYQYLAVSNIPAYITRKCVNYGKKSFVVDGQEYKNLKYNKGGMMVAHSQISVEYDSAIIPPKL
jgi:hypothetical protein